MDQIDKNIKINLVDLLVEFWKNKIFIIVFSLFFSSIAAIVSLNLQETYLSEATLMPAKPPSGLNSMMESYSGLASTMGINIGDSKGASQVDEALAILKSRVFIQKFIEDRDIKIELFTAKKWNKNSNELVFDDTIYDFENKEWIEKFDGIDGSPSNKETHEAFVRNLKVYKDLETKFITIGLVNVSPLIAQEWLSWLIDDLNFTVRQRVIDETNQSINYLNEQIGKTNVKDLRELFYMLVADQTKTVMVAKGKKDYVLKLIDPPHFPEERFFPKRSIIVLSVFLISFVFSLFIVFALFLDKCTLKFVRKFPFLMLSKNN